MNDELFRRRNASAMNIYSATAKNGPRYRLPSKRSMILSSCCFAIVILGAPRLFSLSSGKVGHSRGNLVGSPQSHRCWLKRALKSGEFKLFSHRSHHDNTQSEQPTCAESFSKLKAIGVNHFDFDLVLDEHNENNSQLIVAHPMEFKRESEYYSPCANTGFDEMITTLKNVYGNDFFISMEPKAAWGKTQKELNDVALTNLPSTILEELLKKIIEHDLKGNCAAIVDINEVQDSHELEKERSFLKKILQNCQLFSGIRLSDDAPTSMGDYDVLMPTIEFHPSHAHNTAGKVIPQSLLKQSIFWVVDNEADLELAAS